MNRKTERKLTYPIALLLSIAKRKTFEELAKEPGVSGDTMARLVLESPITMEELIHFAKKIFRKKIYLLLDDTLILKIFSQKIEGACDNYCSSDRRTCRSLCSVVAVLTDGNVAIPVTQKIWISREFNSSEYKKKWEIAQELITEVRKHISIYMVVMDGLYAVRPMIEWLSFHNIRFEMRMHANRVIEHKNESYQLKETPSLKLSGKRTKHTIKGSWKDIPLYFTAVRRRQLNGHFTTVYQVSNYKASAREHINAYGFRWNIEKFFRTAKQKLGLNDCQSIKQEKQEAHIMSVFCAYTIAQWVRVKQKLKNVEEAIKSIRQSSSKIFQQELRRFIGIFLCV